MFRGPQTHNIIYSMYKMDLVCVFYILLDAQFILAGANTVDNKSAKSGVLTSNVVLHVVL